MPCRWQLVLVTFAVVAQIRFSLAQGPLPDIPLGDTTVRPQLFTAGVPVEVFVLPFGLAQQVGPTDLAVIPDGSGNVAVSAFGGRVELIDGAGNRQPTPFLDLADPSSPTFNPNFERGDAHGLTSVVLHPDFANASAAGYKKFFTIEGEFAGSGTPDFDGSTASIRPGSHHDEAVYEYTLSSVSDLICNATCAASKRELMRVLQPGWHHNFGDLLFDSDNQLLVGSGDGSTHTTNPYISDNSQLLSNVFGKILRIDPFGTTSPNGQYAVPASNPFVDGPGGNADEIYAYGLRNPYRLTMDPQTQELWVSDTGELKIESAYKSTLGANHGWNIKEGSFVYDKTTRTVSVDLDLNMNGIGDVAEEKGLVEPIFEYDHDNGFRAIVGGVLYRGELFPELDGFYIFADIVKAKVFYGNPNTGEEFEFRLDALGVPLPGQIHSVNVGAQGEIHVLGRVNDGMGNYDGWIVRLGNPAGDFNADDARDCADIDTLVAEIVAGTNVSSFDLTADGLVDADDLTHWLLIVGDQQLGPGRSYLAGDANLDGVVDFLDFNTWASNRFTVNASWCSGDFDASGVVDLLDLNIWTANRFQSSMAVPEPGCSLLVLIGIVTCVGRGQGLTKLVSAIMPVRPGTARQ